MQLTVAGKTISYIQEGTGKTILFVHGWGGSKNSLQPIATKLSKYYRTICLDLPGFGESNNPEPNWGVKEYSIYIDEFMQALRLNDVIYVGHSFGGTIGIFLAAHYPQVISSLVLCSSAFQRSGKVSPLTGLKKLLPKAIQENSTIMRGIYRLLFPNSDGWKYAHLQKNFNIILNQDFTHELSQIRCPTLILWGALDTQTPVSMAHIAHHVIKNSKLKIFAAARHSLPLRYPQAVTHEIRQFLQTL